MKNLGSIKILLVLSVLIILVVGGGFWYVNSTRPSLWTGTAEKATLTTSGSGSALALLAPIIEPYQC